MGGLLVCYLFLGNTEAVAQSLADKATARQVATEGIKAYNEGQYDIALDRLLRAQQLYDAPVHLLYMARSQVKLGLLVEASENYRLLARYQLDDDAPQAFVQAQEAGHTELADLEPRIPSLEISVTPEASTDQLSLQIDDKEVSAAVIGIARPVNPGEHKVVVSGKGYSPAEGSITLGEGENKQLTLELEQSNEPVAGTESAAPSADESGTSDSSKKSEPKRSFIGFMVGARFGGAIPGGVVGSSDTVFGNSSEVKMNDLVETGLGFELRAGVRLARYFTPHLFFQSSWHRASSDYQSEFNLANQATARSAGIGLTIATPPGQIGGFGEIGLALLQEFNVTNEVRDGNCTLSTKYSGGALRLGGGAIFPVADFLNVTPFASLSLGQFAKIKREVDGCENFSRLGEDPLLRIPGGSQDIEQDIDSDQQAVHTVFFLGVGGELVFGRDMK